MLERLKNNKAHIGVIGLGYVGLPLSIAFVSAGNKVTGFDIDVEKAEKLNAGQTYINHIGSESVREMLETGRFSASSDFKALEEVDAIIICVPTPLKNDREPDLGPILDTGETISKHLKAGQLVVLESSTYPGTTDTELAGVLEKSGLQANIDFHLAYSPEREDPGNLDFGTSRIPKLVGADTPEALALSTALYEGVISEVVPVASARAAEAAKLTENTFRAVNIAMVNELKVIFDKMDIDVWDVINAAATKPFGFMPFYPGPGLGGHCIPIDPFYLTWKARQHGVETRFIELAGEINTNMPNYVVQRLEEGLAKQDKKLAGAEILLIGIAYKKNIDDMRESPALVLIELLEQAGAQVAFHDPHVPIIPMTREHSGLAGRKSSDLDMASSVDAVLIVTDHDEINYGFLASEAALIIDTRNAMRNSKDRDNIVKA
ncbi:nucleotide sugar dehydrogenase [Alphaproteobacteria bacterium]|nr:nucleotide sugar dehydrogenase [Alphaproteobacteria bacterium]MDA8625690.1 nucleotide sugar dehydrogenase [Alphaproteobacteria bacterium]MDA8642633.1 nucleotide sugar dehydrogenase [Alphaproteobacteria bacterium]MDA8666471.1 nucleotide sugar dehydrogenase [Alphaproteobacteria bacterium]MDA8726047.1 nucleotide sugar dehydrogenase [Alphaproteobacteria bacterium]